MEFQPGEVTYKGHMGDHVVVLDERCEIPLGTEVLIKISPPVPEPRPGTVEAVKRSIGLIDFPPEFDLSKFTREDLYD